MKKSEFKKFVKTVLLEVKKDRSAKDDSSKKNKKVSSDYLKNETPKYRDDVDNDPDETPKKLVKSIRPIVNKIGKNIEVYRDDHGDVVVKQPGVFYIRINPKWDGIFDVEAYKNLTDRIYAPSLNYDQVIDFIKVNFINSSKKSYVQTAFDKVRQNLKDNSDKKSKELPKSNAVKEKTVSEKDTEDAVANKKDDPSSPMAPVDVKKVELQSDHGVEKNPEMKKIQKMIKKEVDDDLTKSWKK